MTFASSSGDFTTFQGDALRAREVLSTITEPNRMVLKAVEAIAPQISGLQADPVGVTQGDIVTLIGDGVIDSNGSVAAVEFYLDSDENGILDICHDTLVGVNSTGAPWSFGVDTTTLALGSNRVFAVAIDNDGLRSGSVTQTFNVLEAPVNTAPDAVDDSAQTTEDQMVLISVLANDLDAEDNIQVDSVAVVSQPAHGTTAVNLDGTISYTPSADFVGTDQFSYEVSDEFGLSDIAVATITVSAVIDAVEDVSSTAEDTSVVIVVFANDIFSDPNAALTDVSDPANGTAVVNLDGSVTYTPNADFHGTDSFTYTVTTASPSNTETATVTVTVQAVTDASDDDITTDQDSAITFDALQNDTFSDENASIVSLTQPSRGTASIGTDGFLTYTPEPGFFGSDLFTYTVSSGGTNETATVVVTVNEVDTPQPPVFTSVSGPATAVAGQTVSFLAATQQETDVLSWRVLDAEGVVLQSATGATLNYQPTTVGNQTVEVTATNDDGAITQTLDLAVSTVGVVGSDLYIAGTDDHDFLRVYRRGDGDLVVYNRREKLGRFSAVSGEIIIHAFDGDDAVYVSKQVTNNTQIFGGLGNDWIVGGSGLDQIDGGAGRDWINGRNGDDYLLGADDADIIFGGNGDDWIEGGAGDDWLAGENGNDTLIGGDGDDVLLGGRGRDLLQGMEGDDVLLGGPGHDELDGGPGNDLVLQRSIWWC